MIGLRICLFNVAGSLFCMFQPTTSKPQASGGRRTVTVPAHLWHCRKAPSTERSPHQSRCSRFSQLNVNIFAAQWHRAVAIWRRQNLQEVRNQGGLRQQDQETVMEELGTCSVDACGSVRITSPAAKSPPVTPSGNRCCGRHDANT